jgi:hypothetical protein
MCVAQRRGEKRGERGEGRGEGSAVNNRLKSTEYLTTLQKNNDGEWEKCNNK